MPTYPLQTLAVEVTDQGVSAPPYSDIYASLQASFQSIYGSDAYIAPDSQDGQMLAIFAAAINDSNMSAIAVFRSFSPTYAQGEGLSAIVKLNGLRRQVATSSTAAITIVGVPGTIIQNGAVGDNANLGTRWNLPASVTIPGGGSIVVTGTCSIDGDTAAAASSLTAILTPTRGWQTANNVSAAVAGAPVESDAALRQRQARSTALPSQSVLAAITAAVANVEGVSRSTVYENATDTVDAEGVPAHSISAVVQGGDVQEIGEVIALYKPPGTGTYGTSSIVVTDSQGIVYTIDFFVLDVIQLEITVNITALPGYVSTTGGYLEAAVAEFVSTLDIGVDSYTGRLYSPANLNGDASVNSSGLTQEQLNALSATYYITSITQAVLGDVQSASDVPIAFNEAAAAVIANIDVVVS